MENQPSERINLNTASSADLDTIPGIGHELAREIVLSRIQNGPYRDIADVKRVRGIGDRLYEQIREFIYVAQEEGDQEAETIVFRGVPSHLTGIVPIENRENQSIRRASLRLEKCNLWTSVGSPLTEIAVRMPRPRLQPGERRRANVSLALARSTPPGIHECELVVGGERRLVIFHIAEKLEVNITPQQIFLDNIAGSSVEQTVFVTNAGNVPITINDVGGVEIEETQLVHRALRNAIIQQESSGVEVALDAFTDQLKEGLQRNQILRVSTKNKPTEIPPGETRSLELVIALPSRMPRHISYRGDIRLYNASVHLVIQPTFAEQQRKITTRE